MNIKHPSAKKSQYSGRSVYAGVILTAELPNQLTRLRQVKQLGLGNLVCLLRGAGAYVPYSKAERERWKRACPQLSREIDAQPRDPDFQTMSAPNFRIPFELVLEEIRLCRRLGLKLAIHAHSTEAMPEAEAASEAKLIKEAGGDSIVFYWALDEHTSPLGGGWDRKTWRSVHKLDPAEVDMQAVHDWFIARDRALLARFRREGYGPFFDHEGNMQQRIGMEAGVDVPVYELTPGDPLMGMSAARGTAAAYGAPLWGVLAALGWYRAPLDETLPNRIRVAYNLCFAAGARFISEQCVCFNLTCTPIGFPAGRARPLLRGDEKECYDWDAPLTRACREALHEFNDFVAFHRHAKRGPRVRIAVAMGNLDSCTGSRDQTHVWAVNVPGWEAGDAEQTWQHFHRFFDAEEWYSVPRKYYWQDDPTRVLKHGNPPCGQVDVLPIEAPLEVMKRYRCIVFLGWNTMTPAIYGKLKKYVRDGGKLLMSLPQLSTQTRRDEELRIINGGDLTDLFGVKVQGPGPKVSIVHFVPRKKGNEFSPYRFTQGAMYVEGVRVARVRVPRNGGGTVIATSWHEEPIGLPVMVQKDIGKGSAYLLTTWTYPGPHLPAFLTDILRTIGEDEQVEPAVIGEGISYAVYDCPDGLVMLYIVNRTHYDQPTYPQVCFGGKRVNVQAPAHGMRIVWVSGNLLVSPWDRLVQVEKVTRRTGGYEAELRAKPGSHRIQVACASGAIQRVALDGKPAKLTADREGGLSFLAHLTGKHRLRVDAKRCR